MNVLSVKQPHAFLLAIGLKPIENRTWKLPEKYKNERVLIHASAKPLADGSCISHLLTTEQHIYLSRTKQDASAMDIMYLEHYNSAIIGSVRFVDCVINHPSIWAEKSKTKCDTCVGKYRKDICIDMDCGKYANPNKPIFNWLAADPILFDKPILGVKGKLGFWNYPADILICPYCGKVCLHDNSDIGVPNWGNPVHECEHCKEMILESEFNILK